MTREVDFGPVNIAGLKLEAPVMNGAGPVKFPEHVLEVAKSQSAAVVAGSFTLEEREGNPGETFFAEQDYSFSLNSRGLPNPGAEKLEKQLPEMIQIAHDNGKPLIISIAGFSPEEYARLIGVVTKYDIDGVEINSACPNVRGMDGKQKLIMGFYRDLSGETLLRTKQEVGTGIWVAWKLPPFSNPAEIESISPVLSESGVVKAVTAINTFPNSTYYNKDGELVITATNGFAGMAGRALKPIGLGQVRQLRAVLPPSIDIIGVGGIVSRQDVIDYLRAGADATQITTAYKNLGPSVFEINT